MFKNEEKRDQDLEKGLLGDTYTFESPSSSKPEDTAIPLKTFLVKTKFDHKEPEAPLASCDINDLQLESDETDEELEVGNASGNLIEYKAKIRTFFNVIGALKTGCESKHAHKAKMHGRNQPKWEALHHASANGLCPLIRELLDAGDDPNIPDGRGRTAIDVAGIAFYEGVQIESLAEVLQTLLEGNGTFNTMKEKKDSLDTPLHTAVELGCLESIKLLLDAGASVGCLNSSGLTPLHLCIKNKHEESLKILLKYKCKDSETISKRANTRDHAGFTALQAAVVAAWAQGVNILLDCGADVTATSDLPFDRYNNVTIEEFDTFLHRLERIHETPVHLAADVGNQKILQKLLNKNKSAVNNYNLIGQSPLYNAIRGGHLGCIKTLLNMGVNVMSVTNENQNALHIAIKFDRKKVFELLLNRNDIANKMVNSFDNDGYAPIHTATTCNRVDYIELLAKKNVFLRLLTKGNFIADWTPLHIAAAKNFPEAAQALLKYDKEAIDDVDHKGRLPIHIAAARRNREVMATILREGAVLSSQTEPYKEKGSKKIKKTTTLKMISSELPNPTTFFEEVFDSFIEQDINTEGGGLVTMDYRVFTKNNSTSQIKVLEELVKRGHKKLLIHPLVESLIYLKWKSLTTFFRILLSIHIWFAVSMYFVIIVNYTEDDDEIYVSSHLLLTPLLIVTMLELLYLKIQNRRYFYRLENWTKMGSISLAFLVLIDAYHDDPLIALDWMRHAATAALLLTCAQIMFLFSRVPNMGFYVLMFGKVSLNISKILFTFSFLLFAFALCFMIQYRSKPPFDGPWEAVIKTIVMMTSEFDYKDLFGEEHIKELSNSRLLVHVLFFFFLLFISIVFMNFMVGVAVSNVNDLKVEGNITRLEKQVEFLSTLDVLAFGFGIKHCVSNQFNSKRFVKSMRIKAGVTKLWIVCYEAQTNDEIDIFENEIALPSHILDNIFNKINSKKQQKKQENEVNLLREQVNFIYNFTLGFIDRFLTRDVLEKFENEKEVKRETRIDKTCHRFNVRESIENTEGVKDNNSKLKYYSNNPSTQTAPTETRTRGPRWLGTRSYFTKRSIGRQGTNEKDRVQELKSKLIEEASAFRQSQRKRFRKLERMLKKL